MRGYICATMGQFEVKTVNCSNLCQMCHMLNEMCDDVPGVCPGSDKVFRQKLIGNIWAYFSYKYTNDLLLMT